MYGSTLFIEGKNKKMKIDVNALEEPKKDDSLTFFAGEIIHLINNSLCPVVLGLEKIKQSLEEKIEGKEDFNENEKMVELALKGVYRCTEVTNALLEFIRAKRQGQQAQ